MNLLGNILKLTDYPFAYSIISLVLLNTGQRIDWKHIDPTNLVPLIALIGVLGTTLSIIDPFGNMLRFFIRIFGSNFSFFGKRNILITFPPKSPKEIKYTKNSEEKGRFMRFVHRFTRKSFEYFESFEYFYHLNAKALITNWVTFEIDKTVSTFYFLSILCYISFLLIYNPYTYLNNLSHIFNTSNQTFNTSNQTLKTGKNLGCKDNNCLPININALREAILFATIATGVVAAASIRRLSRRVQIIIIYFASHEHIIPKFKSDNVEVKKISGDHEEIKKKSRQ